MPSDEFNAGKNPGRVKREKRAQRRNIDPQRRRLLTALMLAPLFAGQTVQAASDNGVRRIIALEWLPLEMLFALGVTPLAAADTHDYQLWVKDPRFLTALLMWANALNPIWNILLNCNLI
uniref:hypothetical protein n=1 Tax=Erwinia sp. E_sp_B01_3 TaxID=3039402 RepID=UPI00403F32BA